MTGRELYKAYKGLYPMRSSWGDLSPEDKAKYEQDAKTGTALGHTPEGTAKRVRRRQVEQAARGLMEGPAGAIMRSVVEDMPGAPGHPDAARHVTGENLYEADRKSHGEEGDWWATWEDMGDQETYEQNAKRAREIGLTLEEAVILEQGGELPRRLLQ